MLKLALQRLEPTLTSVFHYRSKKLVGDSADKHQQKDIPLYSIFFSFVFH